MILQEFCVLGGNSFASIQNLKNILILNYFLPGIIKIYFWPNYLNYCKSRREMQYVKLSLFLINLVYKIRSSLWNQKKHNGEKSEILFWPMNLGTKKFCFWYEENGCHLRSGQMKNLKAKNKFRNMYEDLRIYITILYGWVVV